MYRTVDEIYNERNLEVHQNRQNDLSIPKLKEDFIFLVNVMSGAIMDQIQRGHLERNVIFEMIENESSERKFEVDKT